MGYNTSYSLSFDESNTNVVVFLESIKDTHDSYLYDAWTDNLSECKWYDHQADLEALSAIFPEVLFSLEGYGEENEDIWKMYALNGNSYRIDAEITFPKFDISKLKSDNFRQ